jgi:hypothetical protein
MGRLSYEKKYELAYQIYEALRARYPNWFVVLSDARAVLKKRAAAASTKSGRDGEPNSTGDV